MARYPLFTVSLVLAVLPINTVHGESLSHMTGLWTRGDGTVVEFTQEGNKVRAVYVELTPRLINDFGFAPGDEHIIATIDGRDVKGKMHHHYPVAKKSKCPKIWAGLVDMELTLSEDGNTLEGRWRQEHSNFNNCKFVSRNWVPRKYVRVQSLQRNSGRLHVVASGDPLAIQQIELILDGSGSMWADIDGQPKITVAKQVMTEVIDSLPDDSEVALRVYGHRVDPANRRQACQDSELLFPLGKVDKKALKEKVRKIKAKGTTPIAYALRQVVNDLGTTTGENMVILVTDGKEECGENPVDAVAELQAKGLKVAIHIVGFTLADAKTKLDMRQITALTGGRFYDTKDAGELREAINEVLSVSYRVINAAGTKVRGAEVGAAPIELPEGKYTVLIELVGKTLELPDIRVDKDGSTLITVKNDGGEITTHITSK